MVEKRDQQFFDAFLMLVGIFVGIIAGIILLGDLVGEGEAMQEDTGAEQSAIVERIRPVGEVALVGDASLAAAPAGGAAAPPPAPASTTATATGELSGKDVYDQVCSLCHAAGLAGAPMLTDHANWAPRLEEGTDTLREHVLNGFQGDAGVMPPKGGRADLSDAQVVSAMQYMLDQVQQ